MSISCSCDFGDGGEYPEWWFSVENADFIPLPTIHGQKCPSCQSKILPGDDCVRVERWCYDEDGNDITMSPWWLCETCGGLAMAIEEQGLCYTLGGETLRDQIAARREGNP